MPSVKCPNRRWPHWADLPARRARRSASAGRRRSGLPQTFRVGAPSVFVTGTAWVFIVLAVLFSVVAVLRSAEAASLLPGLQLAGDVPLSPRAAQALRTTLPWVLGIGLLLSLATLASAVGLLLRLDWARRGFIAVLGVAVLAQLAGGVLQYQLVHEWVVQAVVLAWLPTAAWQALGGPGVVAAGVALVLAGLVSAACAGVMLALRAPAVRQEFA